MRSFVITALLVGLRGSIPVADAASCPTAVRFGSTSTASDIGHTGLVHGVDTGRLDIGMTVASCAGSVLGACGQCDLGGPLALNGGRNRRCAGNVAIQCTTDAICGTAGPCRFFASPPGPVGGNGLEMCALNEITGPVSGTVNPDDGSATIALPLRTTLYLVGLGGYQPCPTCDGGVCTRGAREGLTCQVDAMNPDFGATSFDCPPYYEGAFLPTLDTTVTLSTGVQTVTLAAESPDCRDGPPGSKCFCDTCDNAAATPCTSNADCVAVGATICGGKRCVDSGDPCAVPADCPGSSCRRVGEPTEPNSCVGACEVASGDYGQCVDGPVANVCAEPESYRGCRPAYEEFDCPLTQSCSGYVVRPCYLDNGVVGGAVSVTGSATSPVGGVATVALGALACGGTPSVFEQSPPIIGLPGLVRLRTDGTLTFSNAFAAPTPAPCRTPVAPAEATLQIRERDDGKATLQWRWRGGAATVVSEFADPVNAEGYALGIYDDGILVAETYIAPGGLCGGKPCWRAKPNGFAFKNRDPSAEAAAQLDLKAGADGKAAITFKGRGPHLQLPNLATLAGPVDVRLYKAGGSVCWGATYHAPFDRLDAVRGTFKDRAD